MNNNIIWETGRLADSQAGEPDVVWEKGRLAKEAATKSPTSSPTTLLSAMTVDKKDTDWDETQTRAYRAYNELYQQRDKFGTSFSYADNVQSRHKRQEQIFDTLLAPTVPDEYKDTYKEKFINTLRAGDEEWAAKKEKATKETENELSQKPDYSFRRFVGQAKEGTKDVGRQVTVGATTMLEYLNSKQDHDKQAMLEFEQGGGNMSHTDLVERNQAILDAEKAAGRKLSQSEIIDAVAAYRKGKTAEHQKNLQSARKYINKKLAADPEYFNSAGWWEDLVRMGPQFAAQVTLGLTTGVAGPAAMMFAQITGATYESLRAKGVDHERAIKAGMFNAALQAPMEAFGISRLTKSINGKLASDALKRLATIAGVSTTEFLTEFAQAFPEAASMFWGENKGADAEAVFKHLIANADEIAAQGAYEGSIAMVMSGVTSTGNLAYKLNKERLIRKKVDATNESIERSINDLEKDLEGLKDDPKADPKEVKAAEVVLKNLKRVREEESAATKKHNTLEDEMTEEEKRYAEELADEEDAVTAFKEGEKEPNLEKPVEEPAEAIPSKEEPTKGKVSEEPRSPKDEPLAKPISEKSPSETKDPQLWRKITVPKIKEIDEKAARALVEEYRKLGDKNLNRNDRARFNRAKERVAFFERLHRDDKNFRAAMEGTVVADKDDAKSLYSDKQIQDAREEAGIDKDIPHRIVNIDPDTYLNLTTYRDDRKENIVKKSPDKFDKEKSAAEGAPLLVINDSGQVVSHDGRHRAATALKDPNISRLPVVVFGNQEANEITAQKFGPNQRTTVLKVGPKPTTNVNLTEDKRPDRYKGTGLVNPKGQVATPDGNGTIFSRVGKAYEDTADILPVTKGMNLTPAQALEVEGIKQLNELEKDLYNGAWIFQDLFDAAVAGSPNIEFIFGGYNGEYPLGRAKASHWWKMEADNKKIIKQRVHINPSVVAVGEYRGVRSIDVSLAHELMHALYLQRVRTIDKTGKEYDRFIRDIEDTWSKISIEDRVRLNMLADEWRAAEKGDIEAIKNLSSLTLAQQTKRQSLSNLRFEVGVRNWEEVMSYTFSDPGILEEFYKIKIPGGERNTLGSKLIGFFFDIFGKEFGRGKGSLADQLMAIHKKYAESYSRTLETYSGLEVVQQTQNSLAIADNPKFPEGSTVLNAAIKTSDGKIRTSGLGHWAIAIDMVPSDFDGKIQDGFAALDKDGNVIKFYTRNEAANILDPNRNVVEDGELQTEDLASIHHNQYGPIDKTLTGEQLARSATEEQKRRKRRLTDADRALLEARKAARGGKSLVEYWAEKRAPKQADRAAIQRAAQRSETGGRWDLSTAPSDLISMKPATLEKEYSRVIKEMGMMADDGKGFATPRMKWYNARKDAIELLQERRKVEELKKQRLREAVTDDMTPLQETKFWKAEYKARRKANAPYDSVMKARGRLIELMGDKFFSWSGEDKPNYLKDEDEAKKKEDRNKKWIQNPEGTGPSKEPKVTVIKPFTEGDAANPEETRDRQVKWAKSPAEARNKFDQVMEHLKENYIMEGRPVSDEFVTGLTRVIKQAEDMGVLSEADKEAAQWALEYMKDHNTPSFFSEGSLDSRLSDPNQKLLSELSPYRVKFDMYINPKDGLSVSGYHFTVNEPGHPANRMGFAVPELTKGAIDKKFRDIDNMFAITGQQQQVMWTKKLDNHTSTAFKSEPFSDGGWLYIDLYHFVVEDPQTIYDIYEPSKTAPLKVGAPITEVQWALYDSEGTATYSRSFEWNEKTSKKKVKSDITKGIAVIRKVEETLRQLANKEFKATKPIVLKWSAEVGDEKKLNSYIQYAKRAAKHLGLNQNEDVIVADNGVFVVDRSYEPSPEQLARAKEMSRGGLNSDDAPASDIIETSTQATEDNYEGQVEEFVRRLEAALTDGEIVLMNFTLPDNMVFLLPNGNEYTDITVDGDIDGMTVTGREYGTGDLFEIGNTSTPEATAEIPNLINQYLSTTDFINESESVDEFSTDADSIEGYFNQAPEVHTFDDPDMESTATTYEKGRTPDTWKDQLKEWWDKFNAITKEYANLKRSDFQDVQYMLRALSEGRVFAAERATKELNGILENLSKDQYHNLQRLAYLMDLREQVAINQGHIAAGNLDPTNVKYPFDWPETKIISESQKAWNIVRRDPTTYNAWRARLDTWFRIRQAYTEQMRRNGFDVSTRLNRAYYFRHQVLDTLEAAHNNPNANFYTSGKLVLPTKRSMIQKRSGTTSKAINLNFLQAEYEVMAQLMYDTQVAKTVADIMDSHGVKEARPGYSMFRPREDNIFYLVNTIPGKMITDAMRKNLTSINVPKDKIDKAVAIGGKYKGYYLPDPLIEALNEGLDKRPRGPIMDAIAFPTRMWKKMQLFGPTSLVKYNTRNMTGDAEAVFIGNPKVFGEVPMALKELFDDLLGRGTSQDLQDWIDRGGKNSGLTAVEVDKIQQSKHFKKFDNNPESVFKKLNPFALWYKTAIGISAFRENSLRYAAYKRFIKEMNRNNGQPDRYAASLREEVEALKDYKDRAYLMANDLLGAYDRISKGGAKLREMFFPFWSFQEVNLKRTKAFIDNALRDDAMAGHIGRKIGAKGIIVPLQIGRLWLTMFTGSMIAQAWNHLMFGDIERELPEEMRNKSHVILGGSAENVYYFPRIGILGDLLEFAGLESLPAQAWDLIEIAIGNKSWDDLVKEHDYSEFYKEGPKAVVNKLVQSFGPAWKTTFELIMSEKVFPSVWERQPITDRWRYAAEQLGLDPVYDEVTPYPTRRNHWERYIKKAFIYKEDRDRMSWLAISHKKNEYLKKHNLKGKGFIRTETGNHIYLMGLSWRYGDMDAYKYHGLEYIKKRIKRDRKAFDTNEIFSGKVWEGLEPLADIPEEHLGTFLQTLTEEDKKVLQRAYKYWGEISSGKQFTKEGWN